MNFEEQIQELLKQAKTVEQSHRIAADKAEDIWLNISHTYPADENDWPDEVYDTYEAALFDYKVHDERREAADDIAFHLQSILDCLVYFQQEAYHDSRVQQHGINYRGAVIFE